MGVFRSDYIMVGMRLDYEKYGNDEWYDKLVEHNKDDITTVIDGMNGEYVFVGQVIVKSDEDEGIVPKKLDKSELEELKPVVAEKIKNQFGIESDVGVWVFSHFH